MVSMIRWLLTIFPQHCTLLALLGAYYTYRDTFDLATTVLSPCGANSALNIASDIRTSNAGNKAGSGYISTDSVRLVPLLLLLLMRETYHHFFPHITPDRRLPHTGEIHLFLSISLCF